MVCLGLKPGAAGFEVQKYPLSYGGFQQNYIVIPIYIYNIL